MKAKLGLVTLLAAAASGACGADPPLQNETDAVISVQKVGEDYSRFSSYVLVSELDDLCEQGPDIGAGGELNVNCASLSHDTDSALLRRIAQNLDDLGYKKLPSSKIAEADLIVTGGLVTRGFWNLAERYCVHNELLFGCVSAVATQTVSAPTGSLIISMIDGQNINPKKDYRTVWSASIDKRWAAGATLGISDIALGGSGNTTSIESWRLGIDKAFEQATYLGAK